MFCFYSVEIMYLRVKLTLETIDIKEILILSTTLSWNITFGWNVVYL